LWFQLFPKDPKGPQPVAICHFSQAQI
jgi:hypothetical protein